MKRLGLFLAAFLTLSASGWAALSASTVWEVRTTGNDTNGGGYVSGGADWSQQDSAQYSVTDAVTAGTTTITSATASFGTDVVGNICYVSGGTGSITAGWYQIASRTNSTTIVVDRSTGLTTGTGVTLHIGGALASPGQMGGIVAAVNAGGWIVWQKSGTYSVTSSSSNVAGGIVSLANGSNSAAAPLRWIGYGSTRGDGGTKPLIQASSITSVTLFATGHNFYRIENLEFDGASQSAVIGISLGGTWNIARKVRAQRCVTGISSANANPLELCEATTCSTSGIIGPVSTIGCYSHANSGNGFASGANSGAVYIDCISASNGGYGYGPWSYQSINCTAYGNTGAGWSLSGGGMQGVTCLNCLSTDNTGGGWVPGALSPQLLLINCAGRNNGGVGNYSSAHLTDTGAAPSVIGFIALTSDPYVAAGSGNFALNTTAGGGAACRAAGIPGAFPGGTTTGYFDIGAVQHADPAAGGGETSAVFVK